MSRNIPTNFITTHLQNVLDDGTLLYNLSVFYRKGGAYTKNKRDKDMNDKNTVKKEEKQRFNFRVKDETINENLSTEEAIKWQN